MTITDISRFVASEDTNPIPEQYRIDQPGVYDQIPAEWYHRDPVVGGSLSASGIKKLIQPAGPARFRHALDHPEDGKKSDALDFGSAAHQVVLGDFENHLVIVDADSWRTKAAQAAAENARARGMTPILPSQWVKVKAMADAIQSNPTAAKLLSRTSGKPEQTMVWRDKESGVMCRGRVDWLRHVRPGRRLILVDFKTTSRMADPYEFGTSAANFDYSIQAWFYSEGARTLGLDEDPPFLFVVQEVEPPYLVNVVQLPDEALNIGRAYAQVALRSYAECTRTDNWPGYDGEVQLAEMPVWWLKRHDEDPRFINSEPTEVSA